ncbi:16S rRNA (guanine(966)-N(2))-methyltransferase RsmD [Methylobacillus rhizosphaerae]|uniref:16S rRNA (Guanine(966)-N(2))-methyltransferase RsmD n=1 Tax=Methylobacillus rhizosphaerae TaxID=551994 RepID=A0A239AGY3_9PROT|nr:16S rRNA (guanine(966)-N(2))-methyltransferase RsmD [Methylobacillus rhizosphaerae]SNR94258.1 16S rRNA (guanine(966)-N(2))-methyltransferase RsmD [Methylobacillus rhizosphaerae]
MAASNRVRISGGEWRSRLLSFPDVPGLRPTPDRVRQTVFNWLGQDMHGRRCLDLFAGTGAMGFEALSRGASAVVLVEKSAVAARSLQQNQALLKAGQATVLQQDAMQFLAQSHERFDVIFLDPPYQQGWLPRLLPLLSSHLAEDGVVYVEAEFVLGNDASWQVIKHGKAGNVCYHLLKLADILPIDQ